MNNWKTLTVQSGNMSNDTNSLYWKIVYGLGQLYLYKKSKVYPDPQS